MITYPLNNIEYVAEDAELFHATRKSGVFIENAFDYSVSGADNTIVIGAGIAWIKNSEFSGKVAAQKTAVSIDLGLADSVYPRIDAVVIRFDANANQTTIVQKKGTASSSPKPPEVERTASVYELHLYHVRRNAGATTVTSGNVTDLRQNDAYCGIMVDELTKVDKTLSLDGYVADAKSVGDAVKDAKKYAEENAKKYLPLSGGLLAGDLGFSESTPYIYLGKGTSGGRIHFYAGADKAYNGGASMMLHQKNHDKYPGWFSINATDGTSDPISLSGKPNGELTWGGQKLYGEHNKPTASDVGAVPASRKVNGKPLSSDVTLLAGDVGAVPVGYGYGEAAISLGTVSNEDELTSAIEAVYSVMATSETKMVRFNGYPSTSDYNFYGILSKSSSNYGSLYANSSYGKGCLLLKTKVAGTWQPVEWINPVMTAGEEYRTAERHLGKPVYVKLINFGALPNSTKKGVAHKISNLGYVVALSASTSYASNGSFIPMSAGSAEFNYFIGIGATDVWITTTEDRTSYTGCYVFVKYTKTTD